MKISVTDRDGIKQILDADTNSTLMEIIRDEGIDIEAACGGCCACATCHFYIDDKWLHKLDPIDDDEESMLDQAFNVEKNSRLSCQIEYSDDLNGMTTFMTTTFYNNLQEDSVLIEQIIVQIYRCFILQIKNLEYICCLMNLGHRLQLPSPYSLITVRLPKYIN